MNRKIEVLRIANNILIAYIISAVILLGAGLKGSVSLYAGCLVFALFVPISEAILTFVNNLILFLLCHITGAFLMSNASIRVISAAAGGIDIGGIALESVAYGLILLGYIIITVIAIYTKIDNYMRFLPSIAEAFLFVVLLIFCKIVKNTEGEAAILISEMIWGILAMLYYNAKQVRGALVTFKDRDFVPYEAIKRNNGKMIRFSAVIAIVTMFICAMLDYGAEILSFVKNAIISFFRWIFSFVHFKETSEEYVSHDSPQSGGGYGDLFLQEEDNSIWHQLWQILFWVVAVAVTVFIIILAVKLIKEFYKFFNSSNKGIRDRIKKDKVEYLNPFDNMDEKASDTGKSKRMSFRERLTPGGRVRHLFKRHIETGSNYADIKQSNTPAELCSASRGESNSKPITDIYEKARYSSHEITSADVKKLHDLVTNK